MSSLSNAAAVYRNRRLSSTIAALLALIPFLFLVRFCARLYVDVPFFDQWGMVQRLDHLASGTLTVADFWGQHGEHRPLVPIAVMLVLAWLTRWQIGWEIAFNLGLGATIFGIFCTYLMTAWRSRGGAPLWLVPVVSLLVFSPVQWENWLWGWQMTVFMCAAATVLGAYLIASGVQGRGAFAGALACGVWATYSFASGLVYWVSQPAGVWIGGGARRGALLSAWAVTAAITMATFFYHFERPSQPSMLSNFASLEACQRYVLYVLAYAGAPIVSETVTQAATAGAAVIAVFAALAIRLRSARTETVFLFPFLVGAQTIGTAAVSGLGRAWMGVEQALSSRYTTFAVLLWCATLCLLALWRSTWRPGLPARALTLVVASLVLVTLVEAVTTARASVSTATARSTSLRFARNSLITGRMEAHLMFLLPMREVIHDRRAVLMRLRLSVFRPGARSRYPVPGPP